MSPMEQKSNFNNLIQQNFTLVQFTVYERVCMKIENWKLKKFFCTYFGFFVFRFNSIKIYCSSSANISISVICMKITILSISFIWKFFNFNVKRLPAYRIRFSCVQCTYLQPQYSRIYLYKIFYWIFTSNFNFQSSNSHSLHIRYATVQTTKCTNKYTSNLLHHHWWMEQLSSNYK